MKLLCLHGLGTNSDVFKAQLEPIIRALVSVQFTFVDANIECPGDVEIAKYFRGPFYRHWDDTRESVLECYEYIHETMEEDGPFDGVVGFSQGAAAAATALLRTQNADPTAPPLFKFAIFFCATNALDTSQEEAALANVPAAKGMRLPAIPTVHVVGQKDDVFAESMTLYELADPRLARLITHSGGHVIPKDAAFARKMQDLIEWAALASGGGG
ncbi:hypothetical protein E8E13_010664 [Curvularia kusanoi]|uniref:Serine hydrolase domain-containing protein n=1 Tax=Curvularia kusanoi TaxID=90978 RepID=A0A9P4TQP4_CURKU|nr:hypothetical protein E8E13_010664 [Curvularia kusanoi]